MDPDALRSEVDEWVRDGIITEQQAEAILDRYDGESERSRAVLALSVVGAALVFAGLTLFLATNWDDLPTAAQVAVLLAGPGSAYAGSAAAYRRSVPRAGLTLSLLGSALAGPALFLLADLAPPAIADVWILLAWAAVALPTGHVLASRVGVGFGLAILAALTVELVDPGDPPTTLSLLGIVLFGLSRSRTEGVAWTYRIVGAAFTLLGLVAVTTLDGRFDRFDPGVSATLGLVAVAAVGAVGQLRFRDRPAGFGWAATATAAVAVGTGAALASPETIPNGAAVALVHAAALAAVASTGYYGYRTGSRRFVDLAAVAALVQTLSFVASTVVDALPGSIALVVAGTLLVAAGIALERGRRSVLARVEG